jgi:hypothetical protein
MTCGGKQLTWLRFLGYLQTFRNRIIASPGVIASLSSESVNPTNFHPL